MSKGNLSKSDIVNDLKLSLPTVVQYLNELMSSGLIIESGKLRSTGGRKAKAVSCKKDARLAIGLDITNNYVNMVLVNLGGTILDSKLIHYAFSDCREYYEGIGRFIDEILIKNKVDENRILGVGISIPAIVSKNGKNIAFVSVSLLNIPNNFYDKLGVYIHFPYRLFNDSNSGGFAEQWILHSSKTIVYFSLSDSVGGAIISNGEIYYGENYRSGEFGHMTIVPDGKKCYCGKNGCFDAYCAAHVLSAYTEGNLEKFFEQVNAGEQKYADIFNQYLKYLVLSIHNLRMCYDCDIILGGYMGRFLTSYLDRIRQLVKGKNMFQGDADFVKTGQYSFDATAVGGALYYIDQFIKSV